MTCLTISYASSSLVLIQWSMHRSLGSSTSGKKSYLQYLISWG